MENDNETIHAPFLDKRMAYSPGEFAALFGKQQTWGYRQLYRGTVKAITQCGRIMIPRSEVDRLLGSAKKYDGKGRLSRSKAVQRTKAEGIEHSLTLANR